MIYRNSYGILINRCCASCKFKDLTRLISSRFCLKHQKSVKPRSHCKQWEMSEQMEAAGSGRGKVKKKAYLKYVLEVREDERLRERLRVGASAGMGERSSGIRLAEQLKIQFPHKSIEQIRKDFEERNGSIYVEP